MRYRAVAVGSKESNTVGKLELECTAHGLFVAYLGAAAFSSGYAPAALTKGTTLTVPWEEISEARVEGEHVLVTFNRRLTPLNRLHLTHFTTGRAVPKEELARRRRVVRFAAASGALIAASFVAVRLFSTSPELGVVPPLFIAGLAALALLAFGFVVERLLTKEPEEPGAQAAFSMELAQHLPTLIRANAPEPTPKLPDVSDLQRLLPRTTLAIVITLSASALGVLLVARSVTLADEKDAATPSLNPRALSSSEPSASAAEGALSPSSTPPTDIPPKTTDGTAKTNTDRECECTRADSLLWSEPLPRLSALVLSRRTRPGRGLKERWDRRYTELELALVNNTRTPLREIALLVLYYERRRSEKGGLAHVDARPLFFPGPLAPGQAIRWKVTARGTEFEIQNPLRGALAPNGEDAADAAAFAALLTHKSRIVRMHASLMLAFLGDPRAKEGALALRDALREDEAPYLNRVLMAQAELRVCQLHVGGEGSSRTVSACLYNAGKEARRDFSVVVRGLDGRISALSPVAPPPTVLAEGAFPFTGELAPRTGRSVRSSFDVGESRPQTYEAYIAEP